jgi:hypothetical protein
MFTFNFWNTEEEEEGETKNNEKEELNHESNEARIQNTAQILSRRSDKDVLKLVHTFQSAIESKLNR